MVKFKERFNRIHVPAEFNNGWLLPSSGEWEVNSGQWGMNSGQWEIGSEGG